MFSSKFTNVQFTQIKSLRICVVLLVSIIQYKQDTILNAILNLTETTPFFLIGLSVFNLIMLTSPSDAADSPDQNKCEHVDTPLHWSGFFRSFEAARAHWVRSGSWFSSPKHDICSKVPIINEIAANCALLSLISSSYKEKA